MRKIAHKALFIALAIAASSCAANAESKLDEIISSVKKEVAPDTRTTIWEISSEKKGSEYIITGKVDREQSKTELIKALDESGVKYSAEITILPTGDKQWGIIDSSIASLRGDGKHSAELVTQALAGTPVKILEEKGSWLRIQTPDNYISYSPASSVTELTEEELAAWKKSKRYIVTANSTIITEEAKENSEVVSQVYLGTILEEVPTTFAIKYIKVKFIDNREGYIKKSDVEEFASWSEQKYNPELINRTAHSMIGVPYLWGGFSTYANDCSGFAKLCYSANGIILQRDASQQALTGNIIDASNWAKAEFGDLYFFGGTRVTHVAIHLQDGEYIHSNGSGQLKVNSVDPESDIYTESKLLTISRIKDSIGTTGITTFKEHPWYF
ncbi:MAG: C40 family peptidase [Bacteroidales bacterium]